MSANDKADAAWDDYVSQQQEEKIEELERELNAANEMFRKLNIHALNLTDRIRRLEEAGDELEYASVISEAGEDPNGFEKLLIAQRKWNKSKEAKP